MYITRVAFPCSSVSKQCDCNTGDLGSIPGLGRSPGEGNGNPLRYSCLENPRDREAWWAAVYGVAWSRTQLKHLSSSSSSSSDDKESACIVGDPGSIPTSGRSSPEGKKWLRTPIFLPGESHGQRSLVGYSPWGHIELDMTE